MKKDEMHPQDRKNMLLFVVASLVLWFGFDHFLIQPKIKAMRAQQETVRTVVAEKTREILPRSQAVAATQSGRVKIDNPGIFGSLSLAGARIDDISLRNYFETLEKKDNVVLMSPADTKYPRYTEFGWVSTDNQTPVPGRTTVWQAAGNRTLAPGKDVTLFWTNAQGVRYELEFSIDDSYLITVKQRVKNSSGASVSVHPYALIAQTGLPQAFERAGPVHQGPITYLDGELEEIYYSKLKDRAMQTETPVRAGWVGMSDKYWLTGLIPDQESDKKARTIFTPAAGPGTAAKYQVDITGAAMDLAPGASAESVVRVFAGAKEIRALEKYENSLPVKHFDLAVDFGMYYFMTKPFFYILDFFGRIFGNFGFAIIGLTIVVRLAVFPLANASYRSFAKMKKVAPQITEMRTQYADDKVALQQALVKLYEKEGVNPMAGCLPILVQIPIFFALYKTLMFTIEMRHAPFFGWIHDLSAHDPITIFNLFGLIPWDPPGFLMIGPWSLLMMAAMLVQKQMNPPPQDPTQKMVADYMPFIITYMLSKFAVGLVIYWACSNVISIAQQFFIMRSLGVEVHLFSRSKADKDMDKLVEEGPNVHPGAEVLEHQVAEAVTGEPPVITPPKPKKKRK